MTKKKATPKSSPKQSHRYGNSRHAKCQEPPQERQEGPRSGPESTIPTKPVHNPCQRNIGNIKSLRRALDAMCAHCMGCSEVHIEIGYRDDIRTCSAFKCPLWHFRPYQSMSGKRRGAAGHEKI